MKRIPTIREATNLDRAYNAFSRGNFTLRRKLEKDGLGLEREGEGNDDSTVSGIHYLWSREW